jgi:hypothetical protein
VNLNVAAEGQEAVKYIAQFLPILDGSNSLDIAHACLHYIHPIANMQNVNTANCTTTEAAFHAIKYS